MGPKRMIVSRWGVRGNVRGVQTLATEANLDIIWSSPNVRRGGHPPNVRRRKRLDQIIWTLFRPYGPPSRAYGRAFARGVESFFQGVRISGIMSGMSVLDNVARSMV